MGKDKQFFLTGKSTTLQQCIEIARNFQKKAILNRSTFFSENNFPFSEELQVSASQGAISLSPQRNEVIAPKMTLIVMVCVGLLEGEWSRGHKASIESSSFYSLSRNLFNIDISFVNSGNQDKTMFNS